MDCVLSGGQIRTLSSAVHCLARAAHAAEVTLEAIPSKVMLRTLNAAKTAFLSITFKAEFFDRYLLSVPTATCCVLVKAVLTIFRTPPGNMETLTMSLENSDATKLKWTIQCANGIRKTYWLSCIHTEQILSAQVDPATFPSHLVVKPKDLNRLLSNFQSTLGEITLIATEPLATPAADDSGPPEAKAVELRSYVDPTRRASEGPSLHTQLWIDPTEELQQYSHTGDAVDMTFSLKELRAFIAFCEAVEVDLRMYFDKAGGPVLFSPYFGVSDTVRSDFEAMLVVASMMESVLQTSQGSREQGAANTGDQEGRTAQTAREQSQQDAELLRTAGPLPPERTERRQRFDSHAGSDRTNIWSELSGSGARQSGNAVYPNSEGQVRTDPHNSEPFRMTEDSMDATEEIQRVHMRPSHTGDPEPFRDSSPSQNRQGGSQRVAPMNTVQQASTSVPWQHEGMEGVEYAAGEARKGKFPAGAEFLPLSERRAQTSMEKSRGNEGSAEHAQPPTQTVFRNPNVWIGNSTEEDEEEDEEFVQATPPEKRIRPL